MLGDVALEELSLAHLEDLRTTMRKRGLSEKTIRNRDRRFVPGDGARC